MQREPIPTGPFIVLRKWHGLDHIAIEWDDKERTAREVKAHKAIRYPISIPLGMMGPREANHRRLLALEVERTNAQR